MSSRLPMVHSIEEEYRYIQFHPFECACRSPPLREITSHGLHLRPMFLIARCRLPFAVQVEDSVEVKCPKCGGCCTYQFDIRNVEHIQMLPRLLGLYVVSAEAVMAHMEKVREVSDRLGKLEFLGKAPP